MVRVKWWIRVSASLVLVCPLSLRAEPSASFPPEEPAQEAASPPPPPAAPAPDSPLAPEPSPATAAPPIAEAAPPPPGEPSPYELPPLDEPEPPESEQQRGQASRDVSLTLSPLHLLSPIVEVTAEFRAVDGLGLALIAGTGSITVNDESSSVDGESFTVYELGVQAVGYPVEGFESLQLGVELLWLRVSADDLGSAKLSGLGEGVGVGPFVGYKLITKAGFTFFVQGGFQYLAAQGRTSDGQGRSSEAEAKTVIPLLNLNLGWSI